MGKDNRTLIVDDNFLQQVEDAVANGNFKNKEIADSVGVPLKTFQTVKHGKRKKGGNEAALIKEAIQRGKARSYPAIRKLAEQELVRRLEGYKEEIVEEETWDYGKNYENVKKTKTRTQTVRATPTELIYAAGLGIEKEEDVYYITFDEDEDE